MKNDLLKGEKPSIGSYIFFTEGFSVIKAKVVSLSTINLTENYFTVETGNGKTYFIVQWFLAKEEAVKNVKKFWSGKINYR